MHASSALTTPNRAASAERLYAAVDVGGTKIAGGLVDRDGALVFQVTRATPPNGTAEAVLGAAHQVVDLLAADPRWGRVAALGVGSAGPVDTARGTVSPVNIPGWRDFPLVRSLAGHPAVGALPVVLGGDAVAMTAAEHWRGAARGHANALCLVVSTGVGGGLVLGGALHPGPTGNAGHLGHISVDLDGEPCPCGSRGCVELIASGTAIARHALRNGWRPAGADRSAGAVAASARDGDPVALAAFDRAAQALAAGIAATATLVEIDLAVIGGGVAQAGETLFAPLRRHLAGYATLSFVSGLRVVPAALGTDAGLVGAAALAVARFGPEAKLRS
ncbi:ROK family protein [Streptacidiphilus cavernicola]|uniref:ROK family protein n=1 Tax=Streptacidiphilus cavernicola TaxID=3342716 RepID=A0ABV6VR97_9ACTN